MKKLVSLLLAVFILFSFSSIDIGHANTNIYNEVLKDPFIIKNDRTLVPMRGIFESLGAEVIWNGADRSIVGIKDNTVIFLQIDNQVATINGAAYTLDAPPSIINDKTYVPTRFITEALGGKITWDGETRTVLIEQSDKKIVIKETFAAISSTGLPIAEEVNQNILVIDEPTKSNVEIVFKGVAIGDKASAVESKLGTPQRELLSQYGFTWKVYHQEYHDLVMVGIKDEKVVALYSNSVNIMTKNNLTVDSPIEDVQKVLGTPLRYILKGNTRFILENNGEYEVFLKDNAYITAFYDIHNNDTLTSMLVIEKSVEESLNDFYGQASVELRDSFEMLNFDITNATRVRFGLKPLQWGDKVIVTTRKHSQDMIDRNYFDHTNPDGLDPFDRMRADGFNTFTYAGENIAAGYPDAIFAHEAWMNSMGHRKNVLSDKFTYLGIGVAFAKDNTPYYTQNFYSLR